MPVSADFQRFVLEQLGELGAVSARRMFGGVGLYHEGLFFGLIDDDTLYLKVDASNREHYVSRGMKPFCPFPDRPQYEMSGYYEVPAEVLEDASQLASWALTSCQVSMTAQQNKPARKRTLSGKKKPAKRARSASTTKSAPKAKSSARRNATGAARGRRAR